MIKFQWLATNKVILCQFTIWFRSLIIFYSLQSPYLINFSWIHFNIFPINLSLISLFPFSASHLIYFLWLITSEFLTQASEKYSTNCLDFQVWDRCFDFLAFKMRVWLFLYSWIKLFSHYWVQIIMMPFIIYLTIFTNNKIGMSRLFDLLNIQI